MNRIRQRWHHTIGLLSCLLCLTASTAQAQINTDRVMMMGRNALYYEDYVLAIQRFNMVINARPYLHEPYFFRALAKFYLEDFTGGEADCTASIERNPYVADNYQLRALCRVNQKKYEAALEDYQRVIGMEPKNQTCRHNMVLCQYELERYDDALCAIDTMIRLWPSNSENYTMKAQVHIAQGDTTSALAMIDTALTVNAYDGNAWMMRSSISLRRGEYAQAEAEADKAAIQMPRKTSIYISRALARYHQNNLQGAMDDYDIALDIQPSNYLAHFNRGLLRAQVGDDNRAIEDFNYVLSIEPDNMIALYNRAILLDNIGDYRGAIRDISAVIDEYPEFWTGYQQRAAIRRKIGDVYGAERDEFKVTKARMDVFNGTYRSPDKKTRRQSQRNIDDYASLVEADSTEVEQTYASEYRGRVQNREAELSPMPYIHLAYHRTTSVTSRYVPFHQLIEQHNMRESNNRQLFLTIEEPTLDNSQLEQHFQSISMLTEKINSSNDVAEQAVLYLSRAIDYYHVRDFEASVTDIERSLALNEQQPLALMALAQVHLCQVEAQNADADHSSMTVQLGYNRALDELRQAAQLQPNMPYIWYNIGCIYISLHDYQHARDAFGQALNIDSRFPEAFFNRAIAALMDGHTQQALSDLSMAGELGLYQAYPLIKQYSK
ncbi:MAG: tetratricopeptide repeat protein [Bacteroidaceae bacterium]|nr:tetratricopeptide repeat protein [Bacteroidaceae bacterium]